MTAPYEADSQLAYFSKTNYVDLVISNDSDLIVFGAKKILFKMDDQLNGKLFCSRDLPKIRKFSLKNWEWNKFLILSILSGCDYFVQGKKKKFENIRNEIERQNSLENFLERKFQVWDEGKKMRFMKAFLVFKYATIYDQLKNTCAPLNEFPFDPENEFRQKLFLESDPQKKIQIFDEIRIDCLFLNILSSSRESFDFLGPRLPTKTLRKVVEGECHPYDHLPFAKKYLRADQINHVFYHLAFVNKRKSPSVLSYFYLRNNNFEVDQARSREDEFDRRRRDPLGEEKGASRGKTGNCGRRTRSCALERSKYAASFDRILVKLRKKE